MAVLQVSMILLRPSSIRQYRQISLLLLTLLLTIAYASFLGSHCFCTGLVVGKSSSTSIQLFGVRSAGFLSRVAVRYAHGDAGQPPVVGRGTSTVRWGQATALGTRHGLAAFSLSSPARSRRARLPAKWVEPWIRGGDCNREPPRTLLLARLTTTVVIHASSTPQRL
jgi:hypothetical protein